MINKTELIKALEATDSIFPEIDDFIWYLDIPGVVANLTPDKTPFSNRVSKAQLTEENADSTISQVLKEFEKEKKSFIWVIGPNTSPPSLGEKLTKHGFENIINTSGMYIDFIPEIPSDKKMISTIEYTSDDPEPLITTMAKGFEIPYENAEYFNLIQYKSRQNIRIRFYLSYFSDNPDPVAVSYLTYLPDQNIVYLSGAATIPEFRGKGIYKASLIKRLTDARLDDRTTGIVSADGRTSAPICTKLGFKKICELQVFLKTIT